MGIDEAPLKRDIDVLIDSFPRVSGADPYLSGSASEAMRKAGDHASAMKDKFVTTEHLLMGILETTDKASRILKDHGMTMKGVKAAVEELRRGASVDSQTSEDTYNSLNRYANKS